MPEYAGSTGDLTIAPDTRATGNADTGRDRRVRNVDWLSSLQPCSITVSFQFMGHYDCAAVAGDDIGQIPFVLHKTQVTRLRPGRRRVNGDQ